MAPGSKDLDPSRPPLARFILVGGNSHFLSCFQAFRPTFALFPVWNSLPEDDLGVGYFDLS